MPSFTRSRVTLLIGVIMIALAAFGVELPLVNLFEAGVGVSFLSGLVE